MGLGLVPLSRERGTMICEICGICGFNLNGEVLRYLRLPPFRNYICG